MKGACECWRGFLLGCQHKRPPAKRAERKKLQYKTVLLLVCFDVLVNQDRKRTVSYAETLT